MIFRLKLSKLGLNDNFTKFERKESKKKLNEVADKSFADKFILPIVRH